MFPLHSPGCNDPDKICSPHPDGLRTVIKLIEHPETAVVPLAIVVVSVTLVYLYQRFTGD